MLGSLVDGGIALLDSVMSATCTRVPVLDGHLVAVSVRFREPVTEADLRAAWTSFVGRTRSPTSQARPSSRSSSAARRIARSPGAIATPAAACRQWWRLRPDPVIGGWKFLALAHNTVRGAAGCSILNAELLSACGYLS